MKKTLRSVAAATLIGALTLAAVGCAAASPAGSSDESKGSGNKGAVAMSFGGLDIEVWNVMLDQMRPLIEAEGYEFVTDDPQWDLQTQIADWESWVARGDVKAIMGYPVQSDSVVAVTQQAQSAGVPVLGYASAWEGTSAAVLISNRTDGINLGEAMGTWIVDEYGADAPVPVALLGYWDTDLGRERSEGMVEGLENVGANVSVTEHSVISLDDGYQAAQNQLSAVPDTKVWLSMGPDQALGAYQALLDSGVDPADEAMAMGSIDATNDILDIVSESDSFWRILFSPRLDKLSKAMATMLVAGAEGDELADVTLKSELITAENIEQFYN